MRKIAAYLFGFAGPKKLEFDQRKKDEANKKANL